MLNDNSSKQEESDTSKWIDVCCHDTPDSLVSEFSEFVLKNVDQEFLSTRNLKLLDLFAGDGRLGIATSTLINSIGKTVDTYFLEIDLHRIKKLSADSIGTVITQNAFSWNEQYEFDLVVSNPPYRKLDGKMSAELGLDWNQVRKAGGNLYSLGILKALELCVEGGYVAVVAPFSWTT